MRYQDFLGNDMPILFIYGLWCAGTFDYPQVVTQHCRIKTMQKWNGMEFMLKCLMCRAFDCMGEPEGKALAISQCLTI